MRSATTTWLSVRVSKSVINGEIKKIKPFVELNCYPHLCFVSIGHSTLIVEKPSAGGVSKMPKFSCGMDQCNPFFKSVISGTRCSENELLVQESTQQPESDMIWPGRPLPPRRSLTMRFDWLFSRSTRSELVFPAIQLFQAAAGSGGVCWCKDTHTALKSSKEL